MKGITVYVLHVAFVIGWLAVQAVAIAGERLAYKVTYNGIFTLGQDMQIADVALQTGAVAGDSDLHETRLEATSAPYGTVESLYPIRYRFRTWTTSAQGELVGFETYENTRKLKHRLYLRDGSELGVRLLDLAAGQGRSEIAQLDAGQNPVAAPVEVALFDRLGLLQRIRNEEIQARRVYVLPVTNGRKPFVYQITVEGAETLNLGGVAVPAWKLRFEGNEVAAGDDMKPAHRPVLIWVSQTPEHIPLRADSRHAVGLFRLELKDAPSIPLLAAREAP